MRRLLVPIVLFLLVTGGALALSPSKRMLIIDQNAPPNPAAVLGSSLKGWWLADNAKDTIINANQFSSIPDASGNANTLTGGGNTGGSQNPTISSVPINGHRTFDFAAASVQFANTPDKTHPGLTLPAYIFGIIRPRANATLNVTRIWFGGQDPGTQIRTIDNGTSVQLTIFNGGTTDAHINGLVNGSVYVFSASFAANGDLTVRVGGLGTNTVAGGGTDPMAQAIMGTAGGFIANSSAEGGVLEWGVANAIPVAANDNAIIAYLKYRAGL